MTLQWSSEETRYMSLKIVELSHLLQKALNQFKELEYFWLDLNRKFHQAIFLVRLELQVQSSSNICSFQSNFNSILGIHMRDFSKQVSTQKPNVLYENPLLDQNI